MNKIQRIRKSIGLALLAGLALISAATASASGTYYPPTSPAINSQTLTVTNAFAATNGFYTPTITGGITESNLVPLNLQGVGNNIVIQFTGQSTTSVATNNAVLMLSAVSAAGIPSITNNATTGWAQSATPRSYYQTITLNLSGTSPSTTNIVLTTGSTPLFSGGLKLYAETILANTAGGALTNYSVSVSQQ